MPVRFLALLLIFSCLSGKAGIEAPPPHTGAKEIPGIVARFDRVVVNYGREKAAIITDGKWLAGFRRILAGARYEPADYCFCANELTFTLLKGNDLLTEFEITHSEKLRFSGRLVSGDFTVGQAVGEALYALATDAESQARPREDPAARPKPPHKVDVKL